MRGPRREDETGRAGVMAPAPTSAAVGLGRSLWRVAVRVLQALPWGRRVRRERQAAQGVYVRRFSGEAPESFPRPGLLDGMADRVAAEEGMVMPGPIGEDRGS